VHYSNIVLAIPNFCYCAACNFYEGLLIGVGYEELHTNKPFITIRSCTVNLKKSGISRTKLLYCAGPYSRGSAGHYILQVLVLLDFTVSHFK